MSKKPCPILIVQSLYIKKTLLGHVVTHINNLSSPAKLCKDSFRIGGVFISFVYCHSPAANRNSASEHTGIYILKDSEK